MPLKILPKQATNGDAKRAVMITLMKALKNCRPFCLRISCCEGDCQHEELSSLKQPCKARQREKALALSKKLQDLKEQ